MKIILFLLILTLLLLAISFTVTQLLAANWMDEAIQSQTNFLSGEAGLDSIKSCISELCEALAKIDKWTPLVRLTRASITLLIFCATVALPLFYLWVWIANRKKTKSHSLKNRLLIYALGLILFGSGIFLMVVGKRAMAVGQVQFCSIYEGIENSGTGTLSEIKQEIAHRLGVAEMLPIGLRLYTLGILLWGTAIPVLWPHRPKLLTPAQPTAT
jgi:hypothetical protein